MRDDEGYAAMYTTMPDATMPFSRQLAAIATLVLTSYYASAQVKEPPRTEKVDVRIHYRIRAERDERVRQFRALEKYLKEIGFDDARKDDPNRDLDILDPNAEWFTGSILSARVFDILKEPHVLSIMFAPSGYAYPDAGDKPVSVRIALRGGLTPNAQHVLWLQTLAQLEQLGFKDALAYDTRGDSQIKGLIPYRNLDRLANDLRFEPSGWFLPNTPPDQLPRPLAARNPLLWVEVMPAVEPPPVFAPEQVLPARARLTPEVRARLVDPAAKETPLIVEALFTSTVDDRLEELRRRLDAAYGPTPKLGADGKPMKGPSGQALLTDGSTIEGAIGNVATIRFDRPSDAERFSQEADVILVRFPAHAIETVRPATGDPAPAIAMLLRTSGVEELRKLGYTGAGVKVIVIGTDFTGADRLIGSGLPAKTRILDLTTELNPEIQPLPADPAGAGRGIAAAKAVAAVAPDAELILARVDPQSLFQLRGIVRVVHGDSAYSTAQRSRLDDLVRQSDAATRQKDAAASEYLAAFQDLADDQPARDRRARAKTTLDAAIAEQQVVARRLERFNAYHTQVVAALKGAQVVVNSLVWESGFPMDGLSSFSRLMDAYSMPPPPVRVRSAARPLPRPPIVWVQAASPSTGAVWGGPFRDADVNGAMEFIPFEQALPADNWSRELNFLGVRGPTGDVAPDLPAGARMRFTMQWREPRNQPGLDVLANPVALRVFRQLDPKGEKRPSDEMAEDARSVGGPYPIALTSTYVVYEQILEFTVPQAGRYAFVVATGYQSIPRLPAMRRNVEMSSRIHVETLGVKPGDPQVVFRSYSNPHAGVGVPGDSRGVIAVGVGDGSVSGGGTGVALLVKPDFLGPDSLDASGRGPGIAAGFLGGVATALVQADTSGRNVFQSAGVAPGKLPVIPETWLRYLRPAPKPERP